VEFLLRRCLCSCSTVREIQRARRGEVDRAVMLLKHPMFSHSMLSGSSSHASFWSRIEDVFWNCVGLLLGIWPYYLYNSESGAYSLVVDICWWMGRWPFILLNSYVRVMHYLSFPLSFALTIWFLFFPAAGRDYMSGLLCFDHKICNVLTPGNNLKCCNKIDTVALPTIHPDLGQAVNKEPLSLSQWLHRGQHSKAGIF
jgi:hypothetical protein